MSASSLRVVVTGLIAEYPMGGMTWHYLQYVLGLARLGHDVYYVEDTGAWPYNPAEGGLGKDCTFNVAYLRDVMAHHGLEERWAYCFPRGTQWFGLPDLKRREIVRTADLLVNVSGTLGRPGDYRAARRMAWIDTDPVFAQIKLALGQSHFTKQVDAHDVLFSFGELAPEGLPDTGHRWRPTRQPIVLDQWRTDRPRREAFTTVMNWTSYKPVRFGGRSFGQKDVEFERFLELPRRVEPTVLELAVNEGKTRRTPHDRLAFHGWRLVDPSARCGDPDSYRTYIETSKGEWSVAKNAYVAGRSAWFSERSACYLAAGCPVIVQDTGFGAVLPVGSGLMPFRTLDEAAAAIREVEADWQRHSTAAREIADACFDSAKVLQRLVESAFDDDAWESRSGPPDPHRVL